MRIDCAKGAGLQSGRRRPRGSDWFRDLGPTPPLYCANCRRHVEQQLQQQPGRRPAGRQTAEGGGERPQDPGTNPEEELAVSWMVAYEPGRGASR